ncbi:MAG: ABC transporter permease [Candidatus Dormiibacterota bacterium]
MTVQVARRLLLLLASLVVASIVVFWITNVLPGDPAYVILGTQATPAAVRTLHEQLGLDVPGVLRYVDWLGGMLTGNFGTSITSKVPVGPLLLQRLSVSGPLAIFGMLIAIVVSVPLGVVAGVWHRNLVGLLISGLSMGGIAIPAFWAGLLLITIFALHLHWLPAGSFVPWSLNPLQSLQSLILPAFALGLIQAAVLVRYIRSAVIEVQQEDFMRTARAKGLTRWQAMWRHGLRNASIPVVTVLGLQLTSLLVGAIVIENVFVLPGLGQLLFQSIGNRDLVTAQDLVMVLTAFVLVVNFLTDLGYRLLDPRLRAAT